MIKNSQRTIYGLDLEMSMLTNTPYTVLENTTLNEKHDLDVPDSVKTLPSGIYPRIQYLTIGNGGSATTNAESGYNYSQHQSIDGGLFSEVPFRIHLNDDPDFTIDLETDVSMYGFKKDILKDGNPIGYGYFLKKINSDTIINSIYRVKGETVGENTSYRLSTFNTSNVEILDPSPRPEAEPEPDTTDNDYVVRMSVLEFSLTQQELDSIKKYTTDNGTSSTITEIGICTGLDNAIAVQICYHVGVDIDTAINLGDTLEFRRAIEIGGNEPLRWVKNST